MGDMNGRNPAREVRQVIRPTREGVKDLPGRPGVLRDALIELAGLRDGDSLLEIVGRNGEPALPKAWRGFRVTSAEGTLEADVPLVGGTFDLVFTTAAGHPIDPAGYARACELIRPGGHLAVWDVIRVMPPDEDLVVRAIRDACREIGEGIADDEDLPRLEDAPDRSAEIAAPGLFSDLMRRCLTWEVAYTPAEYVALIDGPSGRQTMEPRQRHQLFVEISRHLARLPDGRPRRYWGGALHVALRV